MLLNNHPQLYAASCVDLTTWRRVGKAEGGHYPLRQAYSNDGKKWCRAVGHRRRHDRLRKSLFAEVGATEFPGTWEKYREAGKKLKAKGRPMARRSATPSATRPTFSYPYLWSFGGKEVEEKASTVLLNSKETVESVKFMTGFWKDARRGRPRMGHNNNNRAFLSRKICGDAERGLDLH